MYFDLFLLTVQLLHCSYVILHGLFSQVHSVNHSPFLFQFQQNKALIQIEKDMMMLQSKLEAYDVCLKMHCITVCVCVCVCVHQGKWMALLVRFPPKPYSVISILYFILF